MTSDRRTSSWQPARWITGVVAALSLLAGVAAPGRAQDAREVRPVTRTVLADPDPADWPMWRRTYNGWGYSPLDQINRDNVSALQLAWSYALDPYERGLQTEPVVHDGILYLRHPSELLAAHDATTGDLIWQYERALPEDLTGLDGITLHRGRGLALYENLIINFSTDGYLYAVDAGSGALVWETLMFDVFETRHQASGAPIVFDGVIAVPVNCTNDASTSPCHLSAYNADTGRRLWRWHTSPERDDLLHDTWGDDPQRYPLAARMNTSPWMTPAVDPDRGLFIVGIGSSAPMQPELVGTSGEWPDRLYHGSTVALDYRTGELAWWAQHQSDRHNNDSVFDRILVDLPLNPGATEAPWLGRNPHLDPAEVRRLVVGSFSKDGIFYAYDRTDGSFVYARETAPQNAITSYDGETGAYVMNPETVLDLDLDRVVSVCKENRMIPQGAFSPLTNAYYVPLWAGCMDLKTTTQTPGPQRWLQLHDAPTLREPGLSDLRASRGHRGDDREDIVAAGSRGPALRHADDRRRARLRRRHESTLPGARSVDWRGALADHPERPERHGADHVQRGRPSVRGGDFAWRHVRCTGTSRSSEPQRAHDRSDTVRVFTSWGRFRYSTRRGRQLN